MQCSVHEPCNLADFFDVLLALYLSNTVSFLWYDVMTSRPPPLPKNEQKYREEILDRVEEGWLEEDGTRTMPHLLNELLQKNFASTRNPTSICVSHATEGIQ